MNPESTHILQIEEFGEGTVLYRLGVALGAEDLNVLGLKIGVPPKTVATWKHRGSVPYEQVEKVARAKGLSLDYLMLGRQNLQVEDASPSYVFSQHQQGDGIAPEGFILVPRYNVSGSMGNGHVIQSEQIVDHLAFRAEWVRTELGTSPNHLVLISAVGDSMEPTLRAHDLLLIDRSVMSVKQDSIYAFAVDGELRVKRIQRLFDGSLIIKSDNPDYTTETLTPQQSETINIIGRVVWSGRRM